MRGRVAEPTMTISRQPAPRKAPNTRPGVPTGTIRWGKRATSGSARPSQRHDEHRAAGARGRLRHHDRHPAAGRDDAERLRARCPRRPPSRRQTSSSSRGTVIRRLVPARRKATILPTLASSGNVAATCVDPLGQRAVAEEQHAIGAAQRVDRLAREAAALEADQVEPAELRPRAPSTEPNGMTSCSTPVMPPTIELLADAHELVHRAQAAEEHLVAHRARGRRGWRCWRR